MHRDGDVVPRGGHEVVAEAHRRGEPDRVQHAVDVAPLLGQRLADRHDVLGHGDVEFVHVDAVAELAGRALGEREGPAGAGEHDVGALLAGRACATPKASEASVRTPVITIFLPSSRPMARTVDDRAPMRVDDVSARLGGSARRCATLSPCASAFSAEPDQQAAASPLGWRRIGYDVVIGSRSKYRAMEARDELVEQVARAGRPARSAATTPTRRLRPRRDRHAVGLGRRHRAGERDGAARARSSSHGQRARAGRTTSSSRSCRRVAASPRTCRPPCRSAVWSRRSTTCRPAELGHLDEPIDSDVLICGDDPTAVQTVSEIVAKIPGCRPLDAGELSNATAIEAFTAVLLQLNVRYKTRVAPKLTGIKRDPRRC